MNHLTNQKGIALPLVLIIMVVTMMFGLTFSKIATTEAIQTVRNEKSLQAYYLAKSGVELAYYQLRLNPYYRESIAGSIDNGSFNVAIEGPSPGNFGLIDITAIGTVDSINRRIMLSVDLVEKEATPPSPEDFDNAHKNGDEFSPKWLNNGDNIPNVEHRYKGPVTIGHSNVTTTINGQGSGNAKNHSAYVTEALFVEHGMDLRFNFLLTIDAEIIVFKHSDPIIMDTHKNQPTTDFIIQANDPNNDFGRKVTIDGRLYGRVFFNGEVMIEDEVVIPKGNYYFLASGVNLSDPLLIYNDETGNYDKNGIPHLIPIYPEPDLDLETLLWSGS
ncbi:MAG: hypothetical protein SCK28_02880 [Bacillota bacterium]|nr:hypothetical protein [Bacillota bacterium]